MLAYLEFLGVMEPTGSPVGLSPFFLLPRHLAFSVAYSWCGTRHRNLSVGLPAFANRCFAFGGM